MEVEMEDAFDVGGNGGREFEVDFEYEFDASWYFDFSREETEDEARAAEMWFESATGYAPSPLVAKRSMGNGFLNENVNVSPKIKIVEDSCQDNGYSDIEAAGAPLAALKECYKGQTLDDHVCDNRHKVQKTAVKKPFPRSSTLMKPTASQLAKQIWPRELSNSSWLQKSSFQMPPFQRSAKVQGDLLENGGHAPKRQKLEGGCMQKIQKASDIKQEPGLIHKTPQKKKEMPHSDSAQTRLKLTIPREPGLQMAQTKRLIRPKSIKEQQNIAAPCDSMYARLKLTIPQEPRLLTAQRARMTGPMNHREQQENAVPHSFVFKARPLNRKIFEAPSMPLHKRSTLQQPEFQEFHLKTSERAVQHTYAGSSSSIGDCTLNSTLQTGSMKNKKLHDQPSALSQAVDMRSEHEMNLPRFKGHHLSKKEPSFSMYYKQCRPNPPTELFDKLSIAPGTEQNSLSKIHPRSHHVRAHQDSKENFVKPRRQEDEINNEIKSEQKRVVLTQIHQAPACSRLVTR